MKNVASIYKGKRILFVIGYCWNLNIQTLFYANNRVAFFNKANYTLTDQTMNVIAVYGNANDD